MFHTRFDKLKRPLQILRWQYLGLCLLVLVVLILHFIIIMQPDKSVFDESYYITEARSIIANEGILHPEHPPLGKLFIVSGILLLGDSPLGWRFFSVIFGTICIVLFYLICNKLNMPREASLLATSLFTFENLGFVQASVAMLDVYTVTFMLLTFLLYIKDKYLVSGVCLGLSVLTKLTGALAFLPIFLYWLFTERENWKGFLLLVLAALISFLLFMPLLDYAVSGQLLNPVEQVKLWLTEHAKITFTSGYQSAASHPWDWLLFPQAIFYSFNPQYIAMITPTVWILIIPAVLFMLFKAIRGSNASLFGLFWFASTYLPWILITIITDRVTFLFYFYPTLGAICVGVGLGLSKLLEIWKNKTQSKVGQTAVIAVSGYLLLHVAFFIILSPLSVPLIKWLLPLL